MGLADITLHDKYDLSKDRVLLNGTQALVRLMLMQRARDRAAGHDTAGYVTGYRGSPLGAVDMAMMRAKSDLDAAQITFQPGLNEDLAATACWGTQQAELRGEGKHQGVFALWYGKGPGVDRSGDVMRHANMAGTSPLGGVLMAMGDDHTGESSTVCHQSDWALIDAYMPVLSPAGVQEILDYGLYGYALSRFSGLWAGLKLMKDTVEVTSVVDASPHRLSFRTPDFPMPEGGLNIRLGDHWIAQEARIIDQKRFAAEAFSRANRIDRRMHGRADAKIGFVAAGKNWLDLVHALSLLGLDDAECERLGITTYKIGQTFPMDMVSFHDWAEGLDLIVVVEEKRKLIEIQIKEAIFDDRRGRRVYGWYKGGAGGMHQEELFPTRYALDPVMIAEKLGGILTEEGRATDELRARLARLAETRRADNAPEIAVRTPYFCAGCPHNTSTKVPEGSRAYAGIGCHIMALWMDRETSGFTHMGGEGANWIGEAPFSTRAHVFQNIGDGTYNHSGLLAIRAAVAAGTTITYKILYNDAVAMTGGQHTEGDLPPERIVAELRAAGVGEIAVVYDPKEEPRRALFPRDVGWHERDDLPAVQTAFAQKPGVTAIVFIQTCAAEKRRRRKKGTFPEPAARVVIDPDTCEGCGDCGIQSNCVSIVPLETELGRKRAIDQSTCNKDFSCLKGFCPSFMTIEGGTPKKAATLAIETGDLPEPELPAFNGTWNVIITGVGGTGVVTIGAILAMAAHLDGHGAGMMEMAGLAQKGGAVHVHCRLAAEPRDISAIRVATGETDCLIGGDLVVAGGTKTLALTATGRTAGVVDAHETITGDFTRDRDFRIPGADLKDALRRKLGDRVAIFDATRLAERALGSSIFANMILTGAAWQAGLLPISHAAMKKAIELNGAGVEKNLRAFEIGRWATAHPDEVARATAEVAWLPKTLDERIRIRADHLRAYQGDALAQRYLSRVDPAPAHLREAVALGYHKLLTYKDEYEVARLLLAARARVAEGHEGEVRISHHLAPPVLPGRDALGRPKKRVFGPWIAALFPWLAKGRVLRGTPFDPFGYTAERRMERRLIADYEADLDAILADPDRHPEAARARAALPLDIRGFGPVKDASARAAATRRDALMETWARGTATPAAAAE